MTIEEKKAAVKTLIEVMLKDSKENMLKKVDVLFESDVVELSSWDKDDKPMILPKSIICALFESEMMQYNAKGTSYERRVKKAVRNFRYYI